jgi:hypothetical protein
LLDQDGFVVLVQIDGFDEEALAVGRTSKQDLDLCFLPDVQLVAARLRQEQKRAIFDLVVAGHLHPE